MMVGCVHFLNFLQQGQVVHRQLLEFYAFSFANFVYEPACDRWERR